MVRQTKAQTLLMVGLGNPGSRYADTRHNQGARFVQLFCEQHHLTLKKNTSFNAQTATTTLPVNQKNDSGAFKIHCLIPNDFMNHNGHSVQAFMQYHRLKSHQLLIAQDELDLACGTFRFKTGGGHAGHNGLKDVIQHLQTTDFHRLRLGIGHPQGAMEVSDYVLAIPDAAERQQLNEALLQALQALPAWLENNMEHLSHGL